MKKFWIIILALIFISVSIDAERLIILHTNDTHSQIDPDFDGKGGILRRKVIIDSIRNAEKNVLLIDAGDIVQGTLYFNLYGGEVEYALMDSLKYDMQILGNHEFDNGIDKLAGFYKKTKSSKLSANYDFSGTPLSGVFSPYIIKEYDGKKIGFIGINLDPKGIIVENNYGGIKYRDAYKVADYIASLLKEEYDVDKVVVISHIGYENANPELVNDVQLAKQSRNIDLIIGGHSHTLLNSGKPSDAPSVIKNASGKDVVVAQAAKAGKYLGYIDIDLDDDMNIKAKVIPVTKKYDDRIDKSLEKYISKYKIGVDSIMNNTIAKSAQQMDDSNPNLLMNWTADVVMDIIKDKYKGKIDLAIMNKGGIRRDMPKGNVTEGIMGAMFPFNNNLVILKIKGSDLIDAFSVMAINNGEAISKGVSVKYKKNGTIVYAKINGTEIKKDTYYTLLTIDYLAAGNDYMVPLTKGERLFTDSERMGDRIINYVKYLGKNNKMIKSTGDARMHQ